MSPAIGEAIRNGALRLRAAGIESARLDARVLLAFSLGVEPDWLNAQNGVDPVVLRNFEDLIDRRARHEPVAYITGSKEFWSLSFEVGPGVLIPRPETETLIEEAIRMHPDHQAPLNVLDLGTGSGCLLIAFLANYPRANGVGVDASERTLDYARRNAARHNLEARCEFRAGGWLNAWDMTFDVIFANPPYLSETELETCAPEIKIYEPQSAFAAGRDGLEAMRALGPALSRQLATGGTGFVEIGRGQAAAVAQILVGSGLEVRRVAPDLSGEPRCLVIGRAEESGYQAPRNQLEKGG